MEYNFEKLCYELSQMFANLGVEYAKDKAFHETKINMLEREVHRNNETKRKLLEILQEDINGI